MTCAEFQKRLSPYVDGELSSWSRWKVQTHLRSCPECAALMGELEEVDRCLFTAVEEATAPDHITNAVMRRLPAMPPARRVRPGTVAWAAGLAVAGVQVFALYGAYWWGFARGSGMQAQPDARAGFASPAGALMNRPGAAEATPAPKPKLGPGSVWIQPRSPSTSPAAAPLEMEQQSIRTSPRKRLYRRQGQPALGLSGAR
jgi:anti-sigma factor RsiW